jgi:hypothetical protein
MTVSSETVRSISRQEQLNDVLAWTKAPFLFGNELALTNKLDEQRPARTDEVKRLGDNPSVIRVTTDGATVDVAAKADDTELLLDPYPNPSAPRRRAVCRPSSARPVQQGALES